LLGTSIHPDSVFLAPYAVQGSPHLFPLWLPLNS
jgi:hypothetical protein